MSESDAATDRCARCARPFHCGARDAAPCPCTTLTLNAATLAELRARYASCLCLACLVDLGGREKAGAVSRPACFDAGAR